MIQRQKIESSSVQHFHGDDMLETMFKTQKDFHKRLNPDFEGVPESGREDKLARTARNIMMEGAELMDQLNWKEWKKTKKQVEWEQVRYEIADIMAFLMNAAIEAGMTAEDFFQFYMRKAEVNVKRQENKY